MTRKALLVATLVAVLGTSACSLFGNNSGGGDGGAVPRPGPVTDSSKPSNPKPSDPGETAAKGYAEVAYGGSEKVDCGAVNTQVKLTAHEGRAAWTARAQLGDSFVANAPASGVRVSPASGTLDDGRGSTIQVSGAFNTAKFFYVMVVSRSGSTGKAVKFTCR